MLRFRFRLFLSLLGAFPAVLAACGGVAVLQGDGSGGAGASSSSGSSTSTSTTDPTEGCPQGFADCNASPEDGCEIDLTSDPASCGTCGHDCQGGACQTSHCQQVVVATGQEYAYRLAATEKAVYWTRTDGSVLRAYEGNAPEVIAAGQDSPGDIAVNGTHVYWANVGGGTIARASLDGTGAEVVLSGLTQPWSIAVSDTSLAWAENVTGNVFLASLGSGAVPIAVATTPGAWGITMDATNVYWTTWFDGSVYAAPIAGGAAAVLSSGAVSPEALSVSGDRLFFGTASDAGVFSVLTTGGATTTLVSEGGFGVAADDKHVYFGEYDGRIARVPLGGGEVSVLGIGPGTVSDIALTSKSVYWTPAATDSLILKVAK